MKKLLNLFIWLSQVGIEPHFSERKKRALRTANILSLNGVNLCATFLIAFLINHDYRMATSVSICTVLYIIGYLVTAIRFPNLGRSITLISGCLCIADIALYYGGNTHTQFLLLCMASVPLIMFEWEELPLIIFLQAIPVSLVIFCEATGYSVYTHRAPPQDLRLIQQLSLFIGFAQTLFGLYLFARQSAKFEDEGIEYLKRLSIEHQKQIQVQKMSALGEMSAGVAHEVNNPLAIIVGKSTQLISKLRNKNLNEEDSLSGLQKILDTADRIAKIVKALRNFSRNADQDPLVQTPVAEITNDALSLSSERFRQSGVKIDASIDPALLVYCRPTQVSQVLINLFNNSYDAIEGTKNPWIKIEAKSNGHFVDVLVTDSGLGISSEIIEKIMQPFFTTKEIGKGTGLGLSVSKGLMESMKGELSVVKESPHTQFCISIPTQIT